MSTVPETVYPPAETPPAENFTNNVEVEGGAAGELPGELPRSILLYLKDGSVFAITRYTVSDGKLHYTTTYGAQNDLDLDRLDLEKTIHENAARGVTFTLTPPKPGPTAPGPAAPATAPPGQ